MLPRPISIAAAGLAVATEAFLLPPGALRDAPATHREPLFNALPFEVTAAPSSGLSSVHLQSVQLGCPGCDLRVAGYVGSSFRLKGKAENYLDLGFSVHHDASSDRLLVNGFELYPESDPLASQLRASVVPQIEAMPGDEHPKPVMMAMEPQDLGFGLVVRTDKVDEQSGVELISVDLQVIEVGNRFIQGLKNIHIDLVKDKSGALMIGRIGQSESQNPAEPAGQCTSLMCKMKAVAVGAMNKIMKPHCGGKMAHGAHPGAPHHMPHHQPTPADGAQIQYQHTPRTWARLFKQLSYSIVLPVLVGIFAGITISVLGMVVGTLIVGLWRFFVRGQTFFPRRCHRRSGSTSQHKASEHDATVADEKSGLMAAEDVQDVPPSYTDEEATKPAPAV
ncbi:hypothetical protein GGTG_11504 [Gaeumannomyces tritici R3-111a-1]|uniref:DUF7728 domain-containing protein n=1 Tax=Gaeumannomyces tritici (strain R3-111a-1) TaxID=644352 RepID=J3PDD6_GAET3|nr:hypothetical protein GGTG_11504 [Gaeumannomyces tritici R3-111a-1]EJT70481.1 hypothetical protein GGTG_11504 [Gaeumannomyces tritici R3-111a-1]